MNDEEECAFEEAVPVEQEEEESDFPEETEEEDGNVAQVCNLKRLFQSERYRNDLCPLTHSVFHFIRAGSTSYGWYNGFDVFEFTRKNYPRYSKRDKKKTVEGVLDSLQQLVDARLIYIDGTTLYHVTYLRRVGWAKHQGHVRGIAGLIESSFHGALKRLLAYDVEYLAARVDQRSKNPQGLSYPRRTWEWEEELWEEAQECLDGIRLRVKNKMARNKRNRKARRFQALADERDSNLQHLTHEQ